MKKIKLILFFTAALWCLGFISPALFSGSPGYLQIKPYLDLTYSRVCHQQSAKLPGAAGNEFLVCARCSGIYFGVLFSAFILLFLRSIPAKLSYKHFLAALLPMAADVLFYSTGIYGYSKTAAAATGVLFGIIVFTFFSQHIIMKPEVALKK